MSKSPERKPMAEETRLTAADLAWVDEQVAKAPPTTEGQARAIQRVLDGAREREAGAGT